MKKMSSFMLAVSLVCVLIIGARSPLLADFKYPSAYWPLHNSWATATENKNSDETLRLAEKIYDLLIPYGYSLDVCQNLGSKSGRASWICETKGDFDGAIMWLERYIDMCTWLDKNYTSYRDALLEANARMNYLKAAASPSVYALTDQAGKSYPGTGAATSGTIYGSSLGGSFENDSSALVYIDFRDGYSVDYWLGYYKNTSEQYKNAINNGGVIELAWNFSPEGTAGCERVLEAASDSYIAEGLASMAKLDVTVLLRVGAEMNNWANCDPNTYIRAFQKISKAAKAYSNIKLVFSLESISNRNHDFTDFYPGNEYVDWIGVSVYHNSNYASYTGGQIGFGYDMTNYSCDAYYGVGIYDSDPLVVIRPIVDFAAKNNKPMMISECGFSYTNKSGADQTAFAKDQMTKFYSYVNMIYPQIKAVFYFDNTISTGSPYRLSDNSTMMQTYRSTIAENGAYLQKGQSATKTWHEISEVKSAQSGSARLAAYASFPGTSPTSVTYYIDGKAVTTLSKVPYYYDLNISALSEGEHTVSIEAKSGSFTSESRTYTIKVTGGKWSFTEFKAPETTSAPVTTSAPETTAAPVTTGTPTTTVTPVTTAAPETLDSPVTIEPTEPETEPTLESSESDTDIAGEAEVTLQDESQEESSATETDMVRPESTEAPEAPETTAANEYTQPVDSTLEKPQGNTSVTVIVVIVVAVLGGAVLITIAVSKKR